jgi:hypothetical protein
VSQPAESPEPYRVVYSGRVREGIKDLVHRADKLGIGEQARAAFRDLDFRLRIYPQFGEPFQDLLTPGETRWHAIHWQLHIEWVIDETSRAAWSLS